MPSLGHIFSLSASSNSNVLDLILLHFIIIPWKLVYFLMTVRKDPDGRVGGEKLGGVEGRETVIKILREEKSYFQ